MRKYTNLLAVLALSTGMALHAQTNELVIQTKKLGAEIQPTMYGFWLGNAGLQDDLILFPFFGVNRKILRGKCLMLAHGLGIYQFDA